MSVVDDIKSKLDIVDYISRTVSLQKSGSRYKACCPFHAEKTPSFMVDPARQSWRCFGQCSEGGDIFSFAMKQHGWSFREALEELGQMAGVEVKQQSPEQKQQVERGDYLRGLLAALADYYHDCLFDPNVNGALAALNYTRTTRGLSDETIRAFRMGFAPPGWQNAIDYLTQLGYTHDDLIETGVANHKEDTGRTYDRFRNRLMIPICDERGRVIAFGARALAPDDEPKYLNSPQTPLFDKSRTLFGLHLAKQAIRETETAVIVEGYLDVIQAHQAGFTNVIAQMGTAMTEAQLKQIAPKWAKYIVMALDADAAGQTATRRGLEVARQALTDGYSDRLSVDLRILSIPGAKDPDDFIRETPEQWVELVENSTPVAAYLIDAETADLPTNASVQQREAVARRLLPLLLATEHHLYKQDNLQKLALRLRIAERDLLLWADEQKRIAAAQPPRQPQPPPEPPPLDEADLEPPPDADYNDAGYGTVVLPREAALEAQCLRLLLQQPELYYHVNRMFRELAGGRTDLAHGPLADLCADDFSRDDYRALLRLFEAALDQHDVEPLDYMQQAMPSGLQPVLAGLLAADVDGLQTRLNHRQSADLLASFKHHERYGAPINPRDALVEKALRLRAQRLIRESEEVVFLQMDTPDAEQQASLAQRVRVTLQAKHRIDTTLKRQFRQF